MLIRLQNLFQYFSLRHLKTKPVRTAFSIIGIGCGVSLFVAISVINRSTSGYFKNSMNAISGKATLGVSAGELGFPEAALEKVESVPGVTAAVPVTENRTWLTKTNESLMVMGVDLLQEKQVRSYDSKGKAIIGDSMSFIAQPDSLIITDGFAESHGYKMGSKIEVATTTGKATFTVRGILAPTGLAKAYGSALAIMDIDAARLAFGKQGKTDRIDVVTAPSADVEKTAAAIRANLDEHYIVQRPEMQSAQMEKMFESFHFISRFFSALSLVVGIFLIANFAAMSVAERKREIGTLRALGTPREGILAIFMAESLFNGVMGALSGILFGRLLAIYLVDHVTKAMTNQYATRIEATQLALQTSDVVGALTAGIVSSLLAALIPAFQATKVDPVESMRSSAERFGPGKRTFMASYGAWIGVGLMIASTLVAFFLKGHEWRLVHSVSELGAMVGAALLGPAIVLFMIRLLKAAVGYRLGLIPRVALENLLRSPQRTSGNVLTLMVGLTLVVIISTVNYSFKTTILNFFGKVLHADLVISTTGRMQSHETQPLDPSMQAKIEAHPGVLGAMALREVKIAHKGETVLLKYYSQPAQPEDPTAKRYPFFDTVDRDAEDAGRDLFTPDTIMISRNFSLHFGVKPGEMLSLSTPKGMVSLRVVAMVSEFANPVGTLFISRENYQKYFDDKLVSGFAVKLKKGFDPIVVRKELDLALSKENKITIMMNSDIRAQVGRVIDSSFAYTHAIEVAALLVALLGLMNTLLISVMERTREIGLSRSVGMSRLQLQSMIAIEALSQGGSGALVAAALGTLLGLVWVTQSLAYQLGWMVDFYFPADAVLAALAIGFFVAGIAAWYPARRASQLQIVDALHAR